MVGTLSRTDTLLKRSIDSPIGRLTLLATGNHLERILFPGGEGAVISKGAAISEGSHAILERAATQLSEYFSGSRREFDLPLAPRGTEFQREVWRALSKIPYGHTISYGELARRIGRPNASRAVGAANGRNPIPIVIPCHRVIGSDGTLTGFGGGLDLKRTLLELEEPQLPGMR